jgi:dipeptidyl aminopeptidase/acylaminoacyl peptidase
MNTGSTQKSLHYFDSYGSRCEADLYLPTASKPPVVVLAQGYAALRGFGTQGIIKALVDAGIAVFAFDYRGFGGSESMHNEERQLVDPHKQIEDYHAALRYVSTLKEVDAQRIGIWGSSFSGGHVISVAGSDWSRSFPLRAVVAQIPHCDSRSAYKHVGLKKSLGGAGNILKGALLASVGINHTVAVIAKPDDAHFAVLQHPGWYEDYMRMVDPAATWQNAIPSKSLLKCASYNPIDVARNITAPVLIVYGSKDQGIPVDDVQRTSNFIKNVEMFCFDGDHFDAYDGGAHHAAIVAKEVEFFRKHF